MSHYSLAQKTSRLKSWAKSIAKDIKDRNFEGKVVLVYSGMSGVAAATAISLFYEGDNLGLAYVRKEGEVSHGEKVEADCVIDYDDSVFIFVDDMIASGKTVRYCSNALGGIEFTMFALQGISARAIYFGQEYLELIDFHRWAKDYATEFYIACPDVPIKLGRL